jgi:hypothetical protein
MMKWRMLLFPGLLLLLVVGCGEADDQQAAVDALGVSLTQTATIRDAAATAEAAVTPEPTVSESEKPTSTPATDLVATRTFEVNSTADARHAEETRVANESDAAAAATADFEQPVRNVLSNYGVDPARGRVAWIQEDVVIETEGYQAIQWKNQRLGTPVRDFVLSADITWNTQYATTGCGFLLRTDDNEDAGNRYILGVTRGAEGHAVFSIQKDGEIMIDDSVDFFANGIDPLFEWQNDTTNRLTVVARGDRFDIYTNDTFLGAVEPGYGFLNGFVAFLAVNESGNTRCEFDNAWLWQIQE